MLLRAIVLIAGLALSCPVWAERAELTLIPGHVILTDEQLYTTIVLKNTGTAKGNYSVGLMDMRMQEDGGIVAVENGEEAKYSALSFVHIAPKSVSLKPGEIKRLQVTLRKPKDLPDGEYRTHLRLRMVDENADAMPTSMITDKKVSISAKANLVIIAPIIFRNGKTDYTMQLESPKLSRNESGAPVLNLQLVRGGNASAMGDISISHVKANGESSEITFYPGIPVYRELSRRFVSIPLPPDADLSTGSLKITYARQADAGGEVMAETTLALQR